MQTLTDEYYLVFTKGNHWVCRWLNSQCNHIVIYVKDQHNWLKLDPTSAKIIWEILPFEVSNPRVPYALHPGARVVRLRTDRASSWLGKFKFVNCITVVEYVTGLRVNALTPWSLFKKLRKLQGKPYPAKNICSVQIL